MSPDLGVLLAASRADHPRHGPAIAWLGQAIAACATGGSIEILPMVAAGFLRLASSRRIFIAPTSISAAIAFIDSRLVIPGIEMAEPGREWPTFRQLSGDHELAGNDIMAAWTAAEIRAVASHLVTFDRGFTRLLGRTEVTVAAIRAVSSLLYLTVSQCYILLYDKVPCGHSGGHRGGGSARAGIANGTAVDWRRRQTARRAH